MAQNKSQWFYNVVALKRETLNDLIKKDVNNQVMKIVKLNFG